MTYIGFRRSPHCQAEAISYSPNTSDVSMVLLQCGDRATQPLAINLAGAGKQRARQLAGELAVPFCIGCPNRLEEGSTDESGADTTQSVPLDPLTDPYHHID